MSLQKTIGNKAVQRIIRSGIIQAKLSVGQRGDIYEQEADRLSEQIIRATDFRLQRQVEEEKEEEALQTKKMSGERNAVTTDLEARIHGFKGSGNSLPASARYFFEERFGYNFSQTRIHAHSEAEDVCRQLGARAFTTGRDVFFRGDTYNPYP